MSGACVTPLLEGLFEAVVRLLSGRPLSCRLRLPNELNRRTGHRLKHKLVDSVTGEAIDASDKARGYEIGENEFLFIEERDLAQARSERPPPGSIPLTEPPPRESPPTVPARASEFPEEDQAPEDDKHEEEGREEPEEAPAPPVLRRRTRARSRSSAFFRPGRSMRVISRGLTTSFCASRSVRKRSP